MPAPGGESPCPTEVCRPGGRAAAVLQHSDHRERRFGALVTAAPGAGEPVAAPSGPLVEQRHLGVVIAEEPREAHPHAREPPVVTGDRGSAHAGVGWRGYLGGTLIGSGSALLIWAPSLRGYDGQVAIAGLGGQQPLEHAQSIVEQLVIFEVVAGHDD